MEDWQENEACLVSTDIRDMKVSYFDLIWVDIDLLSKLLLAARLGTGGTLLQDAWNFVVELMFSHILVGFPSSSTLLWLILEFIWKNIPWNKVANSSETISQRITTFLPVFLLNFCILSRKISHDRMEKYVDSSVALLKIFLKKEFHFEYYCNCL